MVSYQMLAYFLGECCQLYMTFIPEMSVLYFLPGIRNLQVHAGGLG